jgi:hypothetical protein
LPGSVPAARARRGLGARPLEGGLEIAGQGRLEVELLAGERVHEAEAGAVQELALEAEAGAARPASVARIAADGMLDGRKVGADLVGTAGLEAQREQCRAGEGLADLEVGAGRARPVAGRRDQRAVGAVAADRGVDGPAARVGDPLDERNVLPAELAAAQRLAQSGVDRLGAGDDEQPGGVAVEAVDDAGAIRRTSGGATGESLGEGAVRLAVPGWTTTPAGLSTTIRWSSSKTTVCRTLAPAAPAASPVPPSAGAWSSTTTRSPGVSRWRLSRARPPTCTRPASISRCAAARVPISGEAAR